jgi:hypothetical protein
MYSDNAMMTTRQRWNVVNIYLISGILNDKAHFLVQRMNIEMTEQENQIFSFLKFLFQFSSSAMAPRVAL